MRYLLDTITSKAYWQYILFSRSGFESVLAVFGFCYLILEILDFFKIYTRDEYGKFAFLVFIGISLIASIVIRRPTRLVTIDVPQRDVQIEVMIGDLFDMNGAIMISTNTIFESDVAGGKISPDSLQGQFAGKYFTGNQNVLIELINDQLNQRNDSAPYPMGATVHVNTHGKSFYFTAMSELNETGNASSSINDVQLALDGLWNFVSDSGELQELCIPVVGTGRGRLKLSRKKTIALIAESFLKASENKKIGEKLTVVIRPEDAQKFQVNLYDIKDHLVHILHS